MKITDLNTTLNKFQEKNPQFEFKLESGADDSLIEQTQDRLGMQIPEKTKEFFKTFNGMTTRNPSLEILSIENWTKTAEGLIHFVTFDNAVKVYLDSTEVNQADQWTIVNPSQNYQITQSMSSFWSNKIWHWIKGQKEIWKEEFWKK